MLKELFTELVLNMKTGLVINKYQWYNDFGLGLPITGTFSNVNFGFELGKGPQKQILFRKTMQI
jgi:hypothetical protein